MAEARRLARLIEMPDLRLIARHNPFAGMFDRGPDVEEGDDHTRTLSQRIDSETMNFQVILNALEELIFPFQHIDDFILVLVHMGRHPHPRRCERVKDVVGAVSVLRRELQRDAVADR